MAWASVVARRWGSCMRGPMPCAQPQAVGAWRWLCQGPCPSFHTPTRRMRSAALPSRQTFVTGSAASAPTRWASLPLARFTRTVRRARNARPLAQLLHHCSDLKCAGHRCARQVLHELRTTLNLLGARGIATLGLLALPDRDRQELVVAAVEEQIAG